MQSSSDKNVHLCSSMSHSSSSSSIFVKDACTKYYQEIGAEMISNQLIIRLEKDKNKQKKRREEWDPPCDCVEIQRPTSKKGPKIINADYDDRIAFRVHSATRLYEKEESDYKSQTIAYKMGSCTDKQDSHQCKTITVYPQSITESQEVYSDHITEGDQNIFLLRIKKKAESSEQKNRNVELELRTPKPPTLPAPAPTPVSTVTSSQPISDLIVEDVIESHMPEEITKQPAKALKNKKRKKKKRK